MPSKTTAPTVPPPSAIGAVPASTAGTTTPTGLLQLFSSYCTFDRLLYVTDVARLFSSLVAQLRQLLPPQNAVSVVVSS